MSRIARTIVVATCAVAMSACAVPDVDRDRYAGYDNATAQRMYMADQILAVGNEPLTVGNPRFTRFVAVQTSQICDAVASGTSFDDLVDFMDRDFKLDNAYRFVSNAISFGCPQRM